LIVIRLAVTLLCASGILWAPLEAVGQAGEMVE